MNEKIAQAAPNNGASNASDFQPQTQNPQNIPGNVIQQQSGLQGVKNTQEFFNDKQNATISVPNEPAPAQAIAQPTNDALTLAILSVIAIIAGLILFRISNRIGNKATATVTSEEPTTQETDQITEPKPKQQSTKTAAQPAKKTAPKKTVKKNKRKRR